MSVICTVVLLAMDPLLGAIAVRVGGAHDPATEAFYDAPPRASAPAETLAS